MREQPKQRPIIILISADAEWHTIEKIIPGQNYQTSPYGEWFRINEDVLTKRGAQERLQPSADIIFFHGGWGKIAAAASTQYTIDRWNPALLMNLGTCGGFEGEIGRNDIILVEKTIVYDIIEQMGDYDEHIAHYTTTIDLSWLREPYPQEVRKALLVSGDRDLLVEDIPLLKSKYQAIAGDWESGAIAYVAIRNQTPLLILRGVSDLVGLSGSEAYGDLAYFERSTFQIIKSLIGALPGWLQKARESLSNYETRNLTG